MSSSLKACDNNNNNNKMMSKLQVFAIQRAGGCDTYDFDAVAWSGGECPGAGLLAGVLIRPIGAGDDAVHTVHSVIAAGCNKKKTTSLSQSRPVHKANREECEERLVSKCPATFMPDPRHLKNRDTS